ncbi:MAG: 2-oxoacid:acceptor oxidoreductase subunit alpha [Eubacteriales bacterium]|nr:2-oxoacid:acceptor oxidoreductase subunit alpha [Eubacteriales bacterium]
MALNILIGGAAGQGIDTTAAVLEQLLKHAGYYVYSIRDFMSRVRGGHNFILIRFGPGRITSHSERVDCLIAFNEDSIHLHADQLTEQGFILCDSGIKTDNDRAIKIDMQKIAKDLGNSRVFGSVAVGALLRLLSLEPDNVTDALRYNVPASALDINIKAVEAGYKSSQPKLSEPTGEFQRSLTISGNKALALGALAADVRFYAAYPMSPSTSIMEFLAEHGKDCDVVVEQAEDEIAAINMAIGASFAGVRAMTGTSGGGFSLMVEALGLAGIAEIPIVICDVQRPGPATGLPTRTEQSDLRFVTGASQGEFPRMVIALRDHRDAFEQTVRAFRLAERYRIPVILLSDQYLADSTATTEPFVLTEKDATREANDDQKLKETALENGYRNYGLTEDGITPRIYPGHKKFLAAADSDEHDEFGRITESAEIRKLMVDKRMCKLDKLKLELQEPRLFGSPDCETLLLGWGSMQGPLEEAVALMEQEVPGRVSALVFGDVFPLPVERLLSLASHAKRLINVEQNATGQLALLIRERTGIHCNDCILKYDGRQLSGEEIVSRLKGEVFA